MSMIGMLAQLTPAELTELAGAPKQVPAALARAPAVCLDKLWNGLQFLLEAYAAPDGDDADLLDGAVLGGAPIGPDLGYGRARVLQPAEVRRTADALTAIDGVRLRAGFAPGAMADAEIYPTSIWAEGEPVLHELMTAFVDLVAFYRAAAAAGNAVATYLT